MLSGNGRNSLGILAVALVLIGIALSTRGVVAALLDDEHICRGVSVDGIDVGGLAISEARVRLAGRARDVREESPSVVQAGGRWHMARLTLATWALA